MKKKEQTNTFWESVAVWAEMETQTRWKKETFFTTIYFHVTLWMLFHFLKQKHKMTQNKSFFSAFFLLSYQMISKGGTQRRHQYFCDWTENRSTFRHIYTVKRSAATHLKEIGLSQHSDWLMVCQSKRKMQKFYFFFSFPYATFV